MKSLKIKNLNKLFIFFLINEKKDAGLGQLEVAIIDLTDNKPSGIPLRIVPVEDENQTDESIDVALQSKKQQTEQTKKSRRQQEQQPELVKPSQRKSSKDENKLPPPEQDGSPTKFRVEYVPQKAGPHQIQVKVRFFFVFIFFALIY